MIAVLGLCAAVSPSVRAADRVALVGCDLLAADGPTATFLQIAGESRNRSGFVFRSGGTSEDVAGRSCAQVLADLADDGFEFRDASVSGRLLDEWISIWQDDD
jgi:hypothetical protein